MGFLGLWWLGDFGRGLPIHRFLLICLFCVVFSWMFVYFCSNFFLFVFSTDLSTCSNCLWSLSALCLSASAFLSLPLLFCLSASAFCLSASAFCLSASAFCVSASAFLSAASAFCSQHQPGPYCFFVFFFL